MTETELPTASPAEELVAEIDRQCAAECRALREAAETEAEALVRDAFAEATRHVRAAMEDLRRDGERRLARARAQIATEMRVRDQAFAARILRDGCPMLVDAVADRWIDPPSRRRWIESLTDEALRRLRPGPWQVEHPLDWSDADRTALLDRLDPAHRAEVAFHGCDDFDAGLRILAGGATLDATPERLMADKPATQALLLAGIARAQPNARTDGETPRGSS